MVGMERWAVVVALLHLAEVGGVVGERRSRLLFPVPDNLVVVEEHGGAWSNMLGHPGRAERRVGDESKVEVRQRLRQEERRRNREEAVLVVVKETTAATIDTTTETTVGTTSRSVEGSEKGPQTLDSIIQAVLMAMERKNKAAQPSYEAPENRRLDMDLEYEGEEEYVDYEEDYGEDWDGKMEGRIEKQNSAQERKEQRKMTRIENRE